MILMIQRRSLRTIAMIGFGNKDLYSLKQIDRQYQCQGCRLNIPALEYIHRTDDRAKLVDQHWMSFGERDK